MTRFHDYTATNEYLYCFTHVCDLLKRREKQGSIDSFQYKLEELAMTLSTNWLFDQEASKEHSNVIGFIYTISSSIQASVRPVTIEDCATAICRELHDGYGDFNSPEFKKMMKTIFRLASKKLFDIGDGQGITLISELLFLFR